MINKRKAALDRLVLNKTGFLIKRSWNMLRLKRTAKHWDNFQLLRA